MCRIRVSRGTGQRCRESERQRPWTRRRVALADSEQSKRLGIIASPHVGKTPDDDRRPAVVRRRSGHAHPVASDHARALPHDAPWCDPVQRAVDSPTRSPTSVARVHHHGHRHATSPRRSVVVTFTRRPRHQASAGAGRGTRSSPPALPRRCFTWNRLTGLHCEARGRRPRDALRYRRRPPCHNGADVPSCASRCIEPARPCGPHRRRL